MRREPAEFLINERQQFVGGSGIALLNSHDDASQIAHASRIERRVKLYNSKAMEFESS